MKLLFGFFILLATVLTWRESGAFGELFILRKTRMFLSNDSGVMRRLTRESKEDSSALVRNRNPEGYNGNGQLVEAPENLTVKVLPKGVVILKWLHPLGTTENFTQFIIRTIIDASDLRPELTWKQSNCTLHDIIKYNDSYTRRLYLLPSTKYCLAVSPRVSLEQREYIEKKITTPPALAFENYLKLTDNHQSRMIQVELPSISNVTLDSVMHVVVTGEVRCTNLNRLSDVLASHINLTDSESTWIAASFKVVNRTEQNFTIGDSRTYNGKLNCPLNPGATYDIFVIVEGGTKPTENMTIVSNLLRVKLPRSLLKQYSILIGISIIIALFILTYFSYRKPDVISPVVYDDVTFSSQKLVDSNDDYVVPRKSQKPYRKPGVVSPVVYDDVTFSSQVLVDSNYDYVVPRKSQKPCRKSGVVSPVVYDDVTILSQSSVDSKDDYVVPRKLQKPYRKPDVVSPVVYDDVTILSQSSVDSNDDYVVPRKLQKPYRKPDVVSPVVYDGVTFSSQASGDSNDDYVVTREPQKPFIHRPQSSNGSAHANQLESRSYASRIPEIYENINDMPIDNFEDYVKESALSGLLEKEYELLPRGQTKPWNCGKLPENEGKNRYGDLVAYDDTRVVLRKLPGQPHSDYINASFIRGYKRAKAYIATQEPMPETVNDFWRMVWQEEVYNICLISNVIEDEKTKCNQYWPEVGSMVEYGEVVVINIGHKVSTDYTIRTLQLTYRQRTRKIKHLHYTAWPDHDLPMHSYTVVSFLEELLALSLGNGPLVVQSSAGVGRNGMIILCDICLRRAAKERVIDVFEEAHELRRQRTNMVNSKHLYVLAHLAISECLFALQTALPCDEALLTRINHIDGS